MGGFAFGASGGGGGAGTALSYITQVAEATLSNEFALASLATGILKNTTVTGIPSIAVAGTDYALPGFNADITRLNALALINARAALTISAADDVTIQAGAGDDVFIMGGTSGSSKLSLTPTLVELYKDVGGGSFFQMLSSGAIDVIADTTATWGATTTATVTGANVALTATSGAVSCSPALGPTMGGTGQSTYAAGDTLYASGADVLSKLALGATNKVTGNYLGSLGYQYPLMYHIFGDGSWQPNSSATAMNADGVFDASTFTDNTSANSMDSTNGHFFQQTTSAVTDNDAGAFTVASAIFRPDTKPWCMFRFGIAETTAKRFFVGLADTQTLATINGADAPACRYLGIQYSTNRADTNWQFVRDGNSGGGSQTIVDTTVAVSTSPLYLIIDWTALASVTVTLLSAAMAVLYTATVTTDLIGTGVNIAPIIATRTLTTATKSHNIYRVKGFSREGL